MPYDRNNQWVLFDSPPPQPVLNSTVSNPCLLNTGGTHTFLIGDLVMLTGHVGATGVTNDTLYRVSAVGAKTVTLQTPAGGAVNCTVAGTGGSLMLAPWGSGQVRLGNANVVAQLPSISGLTSIRCRMVNITAAKTNTGIVYVGHAGVVVLGTTSLMGVGSPLQAGESSGWLPCDNLNELYVTADANAQDIVYRWRN